MTHPSSMSWQELLGHVVAEHGFRPGRYPEGDPVVLETHAHDHATGAAEVVDGRGHARTIPLAHAHPT